MKTTNSFFSRLFFSLRVVLLLLCGTLCFVGDSPAVQKTTDPWTIAVVNDPNHSERPLLVFWLRFDKDSYVYAPVMGAAKPTVIQATLNAETYLPKTKQNVQTQNTQERVSKRIHVLETLYPVGVQQQDIFEPDKSIEAYKNATALFIPLPEGVAVGTDVEVRVSLLLCSALRCTPFDKNVVVSIPPQPWLTLAESAAEQGVSASMVTEAFTSSNTLSADFLHEAGFVSSLATPVEQNGKQTGENEHLVYRQDLTASKKTTETTIKTSEPQRSMLPSLSQKLTLPSFEPQYAFQTLEPQTIVSALILGILAGLILNVMPCVLPVLSIKVTALLSVGHGDEQSTRRHFRRYNLFFAAGILTWFAGLALAVGGFQHAWGTLFQQTEAVYGLMLLVFLLSLSLFGVFTLPVLDVRVGGGNSVFQAYLTGLVVTLLATPCSGPLLGGVLGWAALQPALVVFTVFIATGLGMALPYFLLALFPASVRFLPKPGAWVGVVEMAAGFFLLATALYLFTLLPEAMRLSALAVLLMAAFCAWIWGRFSGLSASTTQRVCVRAVLIVVMSMAIFWNFQPAKQSVHWQTFSLETFHELFEKKPILVNFTADWCPTCKVLEQVTLTQERLTRFAEDYDLHFMRVDLTRPNTDAEAFLRALGSVSIPLTAIFPQGKEAKQPVVLRDIYTAKQLEEAVDHALTKDSYSSATPYNKEEHAP